MTKKRIVATVLAALAGLGAVGWYSFSPQDRLAQLEERLAQSHPQIEHINPDRLTDWQGSDRTMCARQTSSKSHTLRAPLFQCRHL